MENVNVKTLQDIIFMMSHTSDQYNVFDFSPTRHKLELIHLRVSPVVNVSLPSHEPGAVMTACQSPDFNHSRASGEDK